ncbi:Protein sel-1 like protein 2 [Dictyocoela muelleri]|nr:Protein sel-1 like protein 2 [Dictyocoela muelleri]KAG0442687.1 Protein sel-1 like protein 2 [Dictyocoela muelleri]
MFFYFIIIIASNLTITNNNKDVDIMKNKEMKKNIKNKEIKKDEVKVDDIYFNIEDSTKRLKPLIKRFFTNKKNFIKSLNKPEDYLYAFILEKNFNNPDKAIQYLIVSNNTQLFDFLIMNNIEIDLKRIAHLLKGLAKEVFNLFETDKSMFIDKIIYENNDKNKVYNKELVMSIISSNNKKEINLFLNEFYNRNVDVVEYLPVVKKLAENGDTFAMSIMGELYYYGYQDKIRKNLTKAMHYFSEGANRGDRISCNGLGMVYLCDPHKNLNAAKHYFERAVRLGNSESKYNLYRLYKDFYNFEEIGIPYLIKSATSGHLPAAYVYGEKLLDNGDYKNAVKFFKVICEYHPVITRLEKIAYNFYKEGRTAECLLILMTLVETGSVSAMKNLQHVLSRKENLFSEIFIDEKKFKGNKNKNKNYNNEDEMQDEESFIFESIDKLFLKEKIDKLFFKTTEKLVKSGNDEYIVNLADCYYYGIGTIQNFRSAFALYYASSLYNNINGICSIAYCYENGIGCERDLKKALSTVLYAGNIDKRAYLFCWYSVIKIFIKVFVLALKSFFKKNLEIALNFFVKMAGLLFKIILTVFFEGKYFFIGGISFFVIYWRFLKTN